jgi:hypothetical protein
MDNPLYTIHARALMAESMPSADEWRAPEATVASLVGLPQEDWPSKGCKRLSLSSPIFMFNLGLSLRVLLQPKPDGRPEVRDFVDQETLDRYSSPRSSRRASGSAVGLRSRS